MNAPDERRYSYLKSTIDQRGTLWCVLMDALLAESTGIVGAGHGIGRAKAALLHLIRSAAEIAAMRAVKFAFDPDGLLSPGVLFAP